VAFDLRDRFETTDGSRPEARAFSDDAATALALPAFAVLGGGGDAFDGTRLSPDLQQATDAARTSFVVVEAGRHPELAARVTSDVARMLVGNQRLAARAARMKRVHVDLVDDGARLSDVGFPASVNEGCAGVFWDQPRWPFARIGLRVDHLRTDPVLVVHEAAHALHRLAFTKAEQKQIDDVLLPLFSSRSAVDELFAIYSEAEFLPQFSDAERRAPGIYGWARRQWSDDHLFTRFVRKLYFPGRPLAGEKAPKAAAWRKFSGG
jgi:hypothetical protein